MRISAPYARSCSFPPLPCSKLLQAVPLNIAPHSTRISPHSTQIAHHSLQKEEKSCIVFIRWTAPAFPSCLELRKQKGRRMTGTGGMEGVAVHLHVLQSQRQARACLSLLQSPKWLASTFQWHGRKMTDRHHLFGLGTHWLFILCMLTIAS